MKQKTFIKLTAWLLAIAINGLIVVVYLNVKGLDGGFLTQIEKGDASLESGDLESALKHYLKAVSIAPDSPLAYLNASATYVSLGDSESAMALMEEYLATSPHSVESYEYLLSLYEQNNVSPQKQFALLSEAALLFPDAAFADRAGELKLQLAEVDAPLLTPEPGSYEDTLKVTISNYEEGDEIFYADNGDQPTRASTRYDPDKGISIKKGKTQLTLIRYTAEGDVSDVVQALYSVGEGLSEEQLRAYTAASPNVVTGGVALFGGTDSYYSNLNDGSALYSAAQGRILTDKVSYLNMTGGRLYYVNASDGGRVYRVKTDGSERERIVSDGAGMLQVAGDRVFYQSKDDGGLYSAALDGSGKLRIVKDRVSCFTLSNGVIYYRNDSEGGALWCCSLDGFDARLLAEGSCNYPAVSDGFVYYVNASDDSICRVPTQGGDPETVVSSGVSEFVLSGGNLYYRSTSGGIFRCSTSGSSSTRLTQDDGGKLAVAGSTLYFVNYDDGSSLYMVSTSGGNQREVPAGGMPQTEDPPAVQDETQPDSQEETGSPEGQTAGIEQ